MRRARAEKERGGLVDIVIMAKEKLKAFTAETQRTQRNSVAKASGE